MDGDLHGRKNQVDDQIAVSDRRLPCYSGQVLACESCRDRRLPITLPQRLPLAVLTRTFLWLHRWLGLAASLPLVLLGISGAIIAFEGELDRVLNPGLWYVTKSVGAARNGKPWSTRPRASSKTRRQPGFVCLRPTTWQSRVALKGGRLAYIDPYSSRVLGFAGRVRTSCCRASISSIPSCWSARQGAPLRASVRCC